jgi:hypothetical protein
MIIKENIEMDEQWADNSSQKAGGSWVSCPDIGDS